MDGDQVEGHMLENAMRCDDHFSVSGIDCSVPVRNGERCEVKCVRPSQLSSNEKEEIFNLLQVNMKDLYEQTWGWNKDEKWKDVFHPESRLIVVSVSPISSEEFGTTEPSVKTISAFVAFRFTWDDEDEPEYPVVYVYELQIAATHHRLGIGQKLMRHCGDIARHWKMQKLMLTVFKCNRSAVKFYKAIGYSVDQSSPSLCGSPKENYEIFSLVV